MTWQQCIDRLNDWRANPPDDPEEGLVAPTAAALDAARRHAECGQRHHFQAPSRVVPTGEGGVEYEYRMADNVLFYQYHADGHCTVRRTDP